MTEKEVAELLALTLRRNTSTLSDAVVLTEEPNVVAVETDSGSFFIKVMEA